MIVAIKPRSHAFAYELPALLVKQKLLFFPAAYVLVDAASITARKNLTHSLGGDVELVQAMEKQLSKRKENRQKRCPQEAEASWGLSPGPHGSRNRMIRNQAPYQPAFSTICRPLIEQL